MAERKHKPRFDPTDQPKLPLIFSTSPADKLTPSSPQTQQKIIRNSGNNRRTDWTSFAAHSNPDP